MRCASSPGRLNGTCSTPIPSSMRLVPAWSALSVTVGSRVCLPRPMESVPQIPANPSFSAIVPKSVSHCRPEPGCWPAGGLAISAMPARIEPPRCFPCGVGIYHDRGGAAARSSFHVHPSSFRLTLPGQLRNQWRVLVEHSQYLVAAYVRNLEQHTMNARLAIRHQLLAVR